MSPGLWSVKRQEINYLGELPGLSLERERGERERYAGEQTSPGIKSAHTRTSYRHLRPLETIWPICKNNLVRLCADHDKQGHLGNVKYYMLS